MFKSEVFNFVFAVIFAATIAYLGYMFYMGQLPEVNPIQWALDQEVLWNGIK